MPPSKPDESTLKGEAAGGQLPNQLVREKCKHKFRQLYEKPGEGQVSYCPKRGVVRIEHYATPCAEA